MDMDMNSDITEEEEIFSFASEEDSFEENKDDMFGNQVKPQEEKQSKGPK